MHRYLCTLLAILCTFLVVIGCLYMVSALVTAIASTPAHADLIVVQDKGSNTVKISGELLKFIKSQPDVHLNVYFINAQTSNAVTCAKANILQNVVNTGTSNLYLLCSGQSRVINLSKF